MRLRSNAHTQQAATGVQQAKVKALGLLEAAQQYADQLQGAHNSQLGAMPEARKRKRNSSIAFSDRRGFEDQLSMPGTPTQDLLPLLRGELRHHQLHGVKWLVSLYMAGLNGILADELECDRRMQVIGLLSYFQSKGVWGPFLIACPASSHPLWVSELHAMLGGSAVIHAFDGRHGSQEALHHLCHGQRGAASGMADLMCPPTTIILTSPEVLQAQQELLSCQAFKYIIVDAAPSSPTTSPPSARSSANGSVHAASSTRHLPPSLTPGSGSVHNSFSHPSHPVATTTAVDTSGRPLLEPSNSGDVSVFDFHSALFHYQQQQQRQAQEQQQQQQLSRQLARQASGDSGGHHIAHFQLPSLHDFQAPHTTLESLLDAMRHIRAPSAGMLLLAASRPHEEEPLHGLWPLLSYTLPDAVRPIHQAFSELQAAAADAPEAQHQFAQQQGGMAQGPGGSGRPPRYPTAQNGTAQHGGPHHAHSHVHSHAHHGGVGQHGGSSHDGSQHGRRGDGHSAGDMHLMEIVKQLRGVLSRFVLSRSAEEVDLAARRGRSTEVNLYDLFASAD